MSTRTPYIRAGNTLLSLNTHHVTGSKVIEKVGKDAMLKTPLPTMYDHQTRTVPRLDRRLGDQLLREVVVVRFKAQIVVDWHGTRLSVGWRKYAIFAATEQSRKVGEIVRCADVLFVARFRVQCCAKFNETRERHVRQAERGVGRPRNAEHSPRRGSHPTPEYVP